jgi:hypothetical protein
MCVFEYTVGIVPEIAIPHNSSRIDIEIILGEDFMNNQQQGDYEVNSVSGQKRYAGSHIAEIEGEVVEESHASLPAEEPHEVPIRLQAEQGNIAYELLLLQQRLAAYEQLHIEEMAELRQEIERLRRVFLQETNSHLRVISPVRGRKVQGTKQDAV